MSKVIQISPVQRLILCSQGLKIRTRNYFIEDLFQCSKATFDMMRKYTLEIMAWTLKTMFKYQILWCWKWNRKKINGRGQSDWGSQQTPANRGCTLHLDGQRDPVRVTGLNEIFIAPTKHKGYLENYKNW